MPYTPTASTRPCICWLFLILFLLFWSTAGQAAPPKRFEIQTLSLVNKNDTLAINLSLSVDDEEGLYNLLKDGAVIELAINIDIQRKREWWSNATLASLQYTSVVRHDPLTREFFITVPGAEHSLQDRNLTRLLGNSWSKLTLPLIPLSIIELEGHGKTYIISGSVGLSHIETPPWLANNSVFWSAEIIAPVSFSLQYDYQ